MAHRPEPVRLAGVTDARPVGERPAGDPLVGLDVAVARGGDDLGGQRRRRRLSCPSRAVEVVAHRLLVERRRRRARLPLVGRPEPRRVGREHLVAHDELAVDEAELELGVGDDDAPLERPLRAAACRARARCRGPAPTRRRPTRSTARSKEMFSSWPIVGLGRRREHRLGQLATTRAARPAAACRASCPMALVLLPRRAGEVAAHDALDRQHLGLAAQHRPDRRARAPRALGAGRPGRSRSGGSAHVARAARTRTPTWR